MSELAAFVLAYCRASGGIVEPPAYGVYDVLLPEAEAGRLGIEPFQRLAFDESADGAVTQVGYGHVLVEHMVAVTRAEPACARFYVNAVRLDKRGLFELAAKSLTFPNARLHAVAGATEARMLFHVVKINFKAAILTDEKREQLISVWMDVQRGAPAPDLAAIHMHLEDKPALSDLPVAPLTWLPGRAPASREALAALLERAAEAARAPLADDIARLQARSARHHELDRERLGQYFDDIESDLSRRIARAPDDERRAGLAAKREAARTERAAKLADVAAKYRVRLELEPVNVALVEQPKLTLAVEIRNRQAVTERMVVWDPLRHVLQPLSCDVCQRPDAVLSLCAGGHLVCADPACHAPQCVDCTRVHCRHCSDDVTPCTVCQRPVCRSSLVTCADCGRGTCRADAGMCHAAGGEAQPSPEAKGRRGRPAGPSATARRVAGAVASKPRSAGPAAADPGKPVIDTSAAADPGASRAPASDRPPTPDQPPPAAAKAGRAQGAKQRGQPASAGRRPPPRPVAPSYSPLRIEVIVDPDNPAVLAIVFHPRSQAEVARREWELRDEGIATFCRCEKGAACPADRMLLRPEVADRIEQQINGAIARLREEYRVSPRRVAYAMPGPHGRVRRLSALKLGAAWTKPEVLRAAQAAFDDRYGGRRPRGGRSR